jgi:hypothetical protein
MKNLLNLAILHHVDQTLFAKNEVVLARAHANLSFMVILTLVANQNVYPIQIALVIKLVFEINVKTLVLESAVSMLSVKL